MGINVQRKETLDVTTLKQNNNFHFIFSALSKFGSIQVNSLMKVKVMFSTSLRLQR